MEIDKDVLISKVFLRNFVWDRRLKGHSNRNLVDKAWQEIAAEMGVEDDGILRKKWKYLRDQFAVEVGKIPPPRSGDSGDRPESKWPYFKSLMFLLGIVKPRTSSSSLRTNNNSQQQDENVELVGRINNSTETGPTDSQVESEVSQQSPQPTQQDDSTQTNFTSSERSSRKRKLSGGNAKYNQQLLSIEAKKTSLLERIMIERGTAADNEDALFFRSLLPHVNNIPLHLKLRFRNHVQQLVDEFAYGSNLQSSESGQRRQYTPEYLSSTGPSFSRNRNSSNSRAPSDHSENEYEEQHSFSSDNS